ncbi:MAG: TonB-dependent receptor plug domain-containing protein, partial [Bacteroidetes bacterium]|nr:TonB-dependent receptor plug domain-containing protein [Bacteroidota bacterium]
MLTAFILAAGEAVAQQRVTVSGTVRGAESGEMLPSASVYVEGTSLGAATNVDGHFVLVGVPAGEHTLRVSYLGYQTARVEVDTGTLGGPLSIELLPVTEELDEVVVTAENYQLMKAAEDVSQVTISPRDLAVLPNLGEVDIFRALQLLPGISGTNEGSSGLYVRGGTPDQNLVLLDGMTVYHVDHFFGFFSAFNADAIKDVQVYKGGFPAEYGGRTSSVVDLTGRTGGTDYGLGVGVNLLSTGMVAEAPLGRRASLLVSARRSYTDILQTGLYNDIFNTLTDAEGTSDQPPGPGGALGGGFVGANQVVVQPDFYFYDVNAKLNYRPTDKDVVALSIYNGQDNLDESRSTTNTITQGGQAGATTINDVYDVTGWGNLGVSGKWSRQWTPRFYSNALVAYSQYFSENTRTTLNERYAAEADTLLSSRTISSLEDNRLDDLSLRLDNQWQASRAHKVDFGFQATRSEVRYENVRDDTLTIFDRTQQAQHLAAYLQDTWKPLAPLQIVAGVRAASYDLTGETYIEPRASFRLGLTDRVHLKGAYGWYNQFVARVVNENVTEGARDFWLLADGETVGVQRSTHYVAGAAYETPRWLVDVEAYR